MISRLPKWIEYGAFILAFVAGFINAIGLISLDHQAISHLSGTVTLLGASFLDGSLQGTANLAGVLLSFLFGASLSGVLLHSHTLKLGHHYGLALTIEGVLILWAIYLFSAGSYYGCYAASAACGVQNALATKYSGAIVRTTHMTGIFTDLGIMFGSALRGETFDKRKSILFLLIISGFICGGTLGTYLFNLYLFDALFIPASICFILAFVYTLYSKRHQPVVV
ncbi:YoaK family protein [Marinomonas arenicola]|uniref:YoaK family protein n=1 Tax=Marinomonas arenicola TaxID=569601 RepID=UPI00311DD3D7